MSKYVEGKNMEVIERVRKEDRLTLVLNRPEKKNAMSLELLEALYHALEAAEGDNVPIIVIRGAGGTFCSGGDVIEFRDSDLPGSKVDSMADYLNRAIMKVRTMPAIVIAVVEGLAVGAGLSLALACDLTIAEKDAIFNMGYRRIGLTPDGGASFFLPRLVGMKRFNDFYFRSRNVMMAEAQAIGLVNIVCSRNELDATIENLIGELETLSFDITARAKELVNQSVWQGLGSHLDKERVFVSQLAEEPVFQKRLRQLYKKK
jgi:2-(1,2-epoxy-1,2-dihydrophenyl)acetyl-CoA isomerase